MPTTTQILQYTGDGFHFVAILCLFLWIVCKKSCSGISGKTQFLYALVFTTRYLDLLWDFHSYYLVVGKIVYLVLTYSTLILFFKYRKTYEYKKDSFWIEALVCPLFIAAAFLNSEVFWSFSVYLEAAVIIPQLYMIYTTGKAERIIKIYILLLLIYKCLYIVKWSLMYSYVQKFKFYCGCCQVLIYLLYFIIPKGNVQTGHRHSNILLRQKSFLISPFANGKSNKLETIAIIGQEVPPATETNNSDGVSGKY